jgi:hypothetical protein
VDAQRELAGPPCPPELEYLAVWAYELHGRSGAGAASLNPVSHAEIFAWARLTHRRPSAEEVHALMQLDAALLFPDVKDPE